jgi:hypothetical protein
MILGADSRKPYSSLDVLVMLAYEQYQKEMCSEHGGPIWLCRNPDPRLQVRVKEMPGCYAKSEVDEVRKKHKDDDENVAFRPEFYTRDDTPLVDFRSSYYDALSAEDDDSD